MLRALLSAALPALLLLSLPFHAFSSAEPAPPEKPATKHGFLRYKVRGLSAVQGGFLSGSIMGVAAGAGMSAAARNFLKLLWSAEALKKGGKLSGNPGMAQINDFIRSGKGFDFSGAPVSAGYDIELSFELVSDGKGNWNLKSGQARYAGNTDADLTLSGDGGNVHRFTDRYRGQATATLTPKNAEITLRTTGKGKDQQMHFDVSASFPSNAVGKTVWSAMGGLQVITREDKADAATWTLQVLGQEHKETKPETPAYTGVTWGKSGPPDSIMRGRETWQDIMDSGVLVEWELWDECSAEIETPRSKDELVFDESTTGRIIEPVKALVRPTFWDQDLHWKFKPMSGSDIDPTPDRANGNNFDLTYTKLPAKNSEFGHWLLEAEFDTDRARNAGCKNPKPHEVMYQFAREANNNPGPAAKPPDVHLDEPDPNWYYYWGQTSAAHGRYSEMRYGGESEECVKLTKYEAIVSGKKKIITIPEFAYGVAPDSAPYPYILICDLAMLGFEDTHLFTKRKSDGIDIYAQTVIHEFRHLDDWRRWFPKKGDFARLDLDNDGIPDKIEHTVAVPAPLNTKHKFFKAGKYDTLNRTLNDEHYLAWMAEMAWKPGSADRDDWSCPGHQATDQCAQ